MSIATVSTNKLPFAIQTILGNDGKQRKISKWERSVCESNLSRRNCDKSYLPQHFVSNSIEKPQKAKPQNSSTTPPRIGYCSQSRILGHKKPRASFTKKQVALLESRFLAQKYLASTERVNLANQLEMSDMQVKTWFQNRRTKWRRQEAEEKEHEDKMMTRYPKCFFARPDIVL
ncbi:unnamed protein product [Litomosoides sigmodontis]|uniref:Homeobox domain-containing protein n=1 Tax=Litomosoides sigmodontis TaxID=42156 RepID=A0A3P6U639_LITSI|nr:unnamed protein product [Litomosoides sigmodontis]